MARILGGLAALWRKVTMRRQPRRRRRAGRRGWSEETVRELRSALIGGILFLGALLLPFGSWSDDPQQRSLVDLSQVELLSLPVWVEPELAASLEEAFAELGAVSLRDEQGLRTVLEGLPEASPWIRELVAAEGRHPRQLEVHLDLREPLAQVDTSSGPLLVDPEGVVLGPVEHCARLVVERRLPRIYAGRHEVVLQPGDRLEDPALCEGLSVARELEPFRSDLAARLIHVALIDVRPMVSGDSLRLSDVDLYTLDGLRVEWGRSRSSSGAGELEYPAATKVENLLRVARRYPGLAEVEAIQLQLHEDSAVVEPARPVPVRPQAREERPRTARSGP